MTAASQPTISEVEGLVGGLDSTATFFRGESRTEATRHLDDLGLRINGEVDVWFHTVHQGLPGQPLYNVMTIVPKGQAVDRYGVLAARYQQDVTPYQDWEIEDWLGVRCDEATPFTIEGHEVLVDADLASRDVVVYPGADPGHLVLGDGALATRLPGAIVVDGLALAAGVNSMEPKARVLRPAAEAGDPLAMTLLASALDFRAGQGHENGPDDDPVVWYERAALAGNLQAASALVARADASRDTDAYDRWLQHAIGLGHVRLAAHVAKRLRIDTSDHDFLINDEDALAATVRAVELNDRKSMRALANHRYELDSLDDSGPGSPADLFRRLAELGDANAANSLGVMRYYQDRKDLGDGDDALHWYAAAAAGGDMQGFGNIGEVREEQGQLDGDDGALEWYRKGAAAGNDSSVRALERLGRT